MPSPPAWIAATFWAMKLVAWLASALSRLEREPAPPDPAKAPVILVHGIHATATDMARLARYLRGLGREVHAPTLTPGNGVARLEDLAAQLSGFIDEKVTGRRFDLVAFSMGGLISRYYVQRLGGDARVGHFVTLATPHHGTIAARFARGPGILQMRRGSDFLRDLSSDADKLRAVKFTSIHTPLDAVIVPPRSSEMPQARNIRIWAALHPSLILERRCLRAIASVLGE
jgi:triacylglycerol lipase